MVPLTLIDSVPAAAMSMLAMTPTKPTTWIPAPLNDREYELTMRQEPKQARMCGVGGSSALVGCTARVSS
jgi:hypothetical protein